jgi:hypothetical protein
MGYQKFVWATVTIFVFVSCSTSQQMNSENGLLEGIIYSVGNEPFTKLGIQASDGTMYILNCSKDTEHALNFRQGKKVKVLYEKIEHSPEGLTLIVKSIE